MATHIKNLIKGFLKKKRKEAATKEKLAKIVDEVLGEKLKPRVQIRGIYKNKVIFYTEAAMVSYELNLIRGKLLEAIKEEFPQIEDIKINIS